MIIRSAVKDRDIDEVRKLFREYVEALGVQLDFQDFSRELNRLPGRYAPPDGILLIAEENNDVLGCVALRRFGSSDIETCEMKRLYVRSEARGKNLGRELSLAVISKAVEMGYGTMVLDTLDRLKAAMSLYESLGFKKTAPYYENPLPGVVYWKLDLKEYAIERQ